MVTDLARVQIPDGKRDRPGRFHRRLADELGCICTKLNGDNFGKPGWPAGRRPVRARRTRSPLLTESFRPLGRGRIPSRRRRDEEYYLNSEGAWLAPFIPAGSRDPAYNGLREAALT